MSAIRIWQNFKDLLDVSWGSIADGQTLRRTGTNIVGYTPAGGSGDVVGPAGGVVDGEVASYNSTTGKLIKASAAKLSAEDLVTGPASVTTGRVASFNGTTGKVIQQGTQLASDLVSGPASSTDAGLVVFSGTSGKIVKAPSATEASALLTPTIWTVRNRSYNTIGNPNFDVDQICVGATITGWGAQAGGGGYPLDRWWTSFAGTTQTARFSFGQQTTGRPTVSGGNMWLGNKYERITLTTAQATLSTNNYYGLAQSIEGSDARELYGDVHSLQLMVRSSVANLKFSIALQDAAGTRSWVQLCSLGAANTWTLFTFPNIPVFDAGATWASTPGNAGYYLYIGLACGTTLITSTLGSWVTGNFVGASGMSNFCNSAVNSTFDFGFVQHEPGPECSAIIVPHFQESYQQCCRYFQKSYDYDTAAGTATYAGSAQMFAYNYAANCAIGFPVKMAKIPGTFQAYSPQTGAAGTVYNSETATNWTATAPLNQGTNGFSGFGVSGSPSGNLKVWYFHWTADTRF